MIFVTVGTDRFEKLVQAADQLAGNIDEEVIIQKGNSNWEVKNAKSFVFTPDFDSYVKKARVIISHGGAGTIFDLLARGKKIIGLANLNRIDKHQTEILEQLDKSGYLIYCRDFNLAECLKKADEMSFKEYKKPGFWIDKKIEEIV